MKKRLCLTLALCMLVMLVPTVAPAEPSISVTDMYVEYGSTGDIVIFMNTSVVSGIDDFFIDMQGITHGGLILMGQDNGYAKINHAGTSGPDVGIHDVEVTFTYTDDSGNIQSLPIDTKLTVTPTNESSIGLSVSPTALTFNLEEGYTPSGQSVTSKNNSSQLVGQDLISYNYIQLSPSQFITPSAGVHNGPGTTTVVVTPVAGLSASGSSYTENVNFHDKTVKVTINVTPATATEPLASLTVDGVAAVIDNATQTATVTVPATSDLSNLSVNAKAGAGYNIDGGESFFADASSGTFSITIEVSDGSQRFYSVTVTQDAGGTTTYTSTESTWEPVDKTYEKAIVVGVKEWANVRSGPGTNHDIIGQALLGETLELLEWNGDETWCKITYNGGNNGGWLYRKFIRPVK